MRSGYFVIVVFCLLLLIVWLFVFPFGLFECWLIMLITFGFFCYLICLFGLDCLIRILLDVDYVGWIWCEGLI